MVSFRELESYVYGTPTKRHSTPSNNIHASAVTNIKRAPTAAESAFPGSHRDSGTELRGNRPTQLINKEGAYPHPAKRQKLSIQNPLETKFNPAHNTRPLFDTSLTLHEVVHDHRVAAASCPSSSDTTSQNSIADNTVGYKTPASSDSQILHVGSRHTPFKEQYHLQRGPKKKQPNALAVRKNTESCPVQTSTQKKKEHLSKSDVVSGSVLRDTQTSALSLTRRLSDAATSSDVATNPMYLKGSIARSIREPSLVLVAASIGRTPGCIRLPYKSKRPKVRRDDRICAIKHADFSDLERQAIIATVEELYGPLSAKLPTDSVRLRLGRKLQELREKDFDAITRLAHAKTELASTRKRKAIRKYLSKTMDETPAIASPAGAFLVRVEEAAVRPHPDLDPTISSLLRHREIGCGRMDRRTQQELRYAFIDNLACVRSWKGASGDIVASTWSPDSQTYVVGATATANAEDLQYNRPNNLLYGNAINCTIHELPDHRIPRPKPNTFASGPNASEAVYDACDPMVYRTVTAVQFSSEGDQLYSASHDGTVKVWDVKQTNIPICTDTLTHSAHVTALEVSQRFSHTFATASHTLENSVRVYAQHDDSTWDCISLESDRSRQKPQHEIYPECLRWGLTSATEHLLLAGFTRWGDLPDNNPAREGDLCLWNVAIGAKLKIMPSAQNVYTAAFHPFLDAFSTGSCPGSKLTHQWTTRSVVRTWDRRSGSPHAMFEYECPALDMQDLVFHPREANILVVGCTDGSIYVWDARNPEHPLHHFEHGEPIADWEHRYDDDPMTREQGDGGVNMTVWGAGKNHLFTGATDGAVKCWDINRSPEDAFVRDVAQLQAGVSCGSFSPDCVSLLVGDSTGGVHILSSDPGGAGPRQVGPKAEPQPITYIAAERHEPPASTNGLMPGQLAARELLDTQQLIMDPELGIGKGPAYAGPYATYAREPGAPGDARLLREYEKQQPVSRHGRVRDNTATRNIKGTIARRRAELGRVKEADIVELTSVVEDVMLEKKTSEASAEMSAPDEDDLEDDHWFPRMDEEVFAKLKQKYA